MSIAKQVFSWINEHPYIIYALKKDLINYSSLSRLIQKELSIKNFDAVIVAVRRYQKNIETIKSTGKAIIDLLKNSTLEIRTGINVYIVKSLDIKTLQKTKHFHLIQGTDATIVITNQELDVDTIKTHKNMIEVKITSPVELETTPGVVAYIYSAVAEKGINIVETYSCFRDTIFILNKQDLTRVVKVLEKLGVK
jgi:hypothetical protein